MVPRCPTARIAYACVDPPVRGERLFPRSSCTFSVHAFVSVLASLGTVLSILSGLQGLGLSAGALAIGRHHRVGLALAYLEKGRIVMHVNRKAIPHTARPISIKIGPHNSHGAIPAVTKLEKAS